MSIMQTDSADGRLKKRRKVSHRSDKESKVEDGRFALDEGVESEPKPPKSHIPSTGIQAASPGPNKNASRPSAVLPQGSLGKSSVLSLQLSDLVAERTPNYERYLTQASPALERLETLIKSTPDRDNLTAEVAQKVLSKESKIAIPFPQPRPGKDTKYRFEYRGPDSINVRGALHHKLSIKGPQVLIVAVMMSASLFQEKDYLNLRAFHKRSFYLACIAANIKSGAASEFDIKYEYQESIELLPCLSVVTKDGAVTDGGPQSLRFLITPVFPAGAFPVEKLLPTKNCVRSPANPENKQQVPTPYYNSCLQSLSSTGFDDELITTACQRCPAFADGCRIAEVWLKQRGLSSAADGGGFGGVEWAIICATLLHTGGHCDQPLFSDRYSSLQLFKAMLQVLSGRDLREPMLVNSDKFLIPKSENPVFYDGKTGVNVLYKMTSWSYQNLKHHAQLSLNSVNSKLDSSFDATFTLQPAEPLLQYDELFSVKVPQSAGQGSDIQNDTLEKLFQSLKRGLGDRVSHTHITLPKTAKWPVSKTFPPLNESNHNVEIGILVNAETVSRLVDHGPHADEQDDAADFRKFWGDKSELRRFKDGTISESLVWSVNAPVTLQIIQHLLLLHFDLLPSSISYRSKDLEKTLLNDHSSVAIADSFKLIGNKFQELSSALHRLEGLPMPVRSVLPADPALRSSSAHHPLLLHSSLPIDVIVQFDSSTRWPDSLPAIQHTKIAFLLKLGDLVSASDKSLTTRVGLEHTSSATTGYFNTSYLDIIFPSPGSGLSPICFRTRIYHDREAHLLQSSLADRSLHGAVRDSLATALAAHKSDFLAKPIHTTTIRSLCTRFPALSPTIRLLKKWMSSHLLGRHIPEEIQELLAAHIFLHPAPWAAPGSPTTAFLRILHRLSHWDWPFNPLIIDLSLAQDMPDTTRSEIQTRFQAWRKLDPNMNNVAWFVGSNLDPTGTVWTQGANPPKVVAGRVRALAAAAIDLVTTKGPADMQDSDWDGLFVSPLENFDFLIHLRRSVVRGGGGVGGGSKNLMTTTAAPPNGTKSSEMVSYKNLLVQQELEVSDIGFDAVDLYLQDLEHAFGNTALFFHDSQNGGNVIAGLWRPTVHGRKEWRVRQGYSSLPVAVSFDAELDGEAKAKAEAETVNGTAHSVKVLSEMNKSAVLAEMALLGEGLVKEIKEK